MSVGTSICPSVHNSHIICSPSLWVASLLDWMPMDVCYASCCCSFLCSFHYASSFYYHGYDYYSYGDCCVFCNIVYSPSSYYNPLLDGLPATSGQHDEVLPPHLISRHSGGVAGLSTVPEQQPPSDASSGLCQLCNGSSTGRFLFQS